MMNKENLLKCPYCNHEGELCDFPDLFFGDCETSKELLDQESLLNEIQATGFNIVTCGECGNALIHKI